MTEAAVFLTRFTQAIATMTLYREGHPSRERVIDGAYRALLDLQAKEARPVFTFLGEEIVCGREAVRELRAWDWGPRLARAGIQRMELEPGISRVELEEFLDDVLARLSATAAGTAGARQMRSSRIRFGSVGVRGELHEEAVPTRIAEFSLGVEAEAIRWLHDQVQHEHQLHLSEAEAVVRSLSVAMHADRELLIPLLKLRSYDEYTTTHALNVSVLTMAFGEALGMDAGDVRAFGVAGLLHDIGKVNIPIELLTKPGKLTDEERLIMNRHPVDGARIIIETQNHLDLAAIVAYEHHVMLDGGGYPRFQFPRECHYASRMVHLCDVYDALRTKRPYRDAWPAARVLDYIDQRAGTEFDPELAGAFTSMMRARESDVVSVDESGDVLS